MEKSARLGDEFLVEFTYDSNAIEGNTLTLQETAMVLEGITVDRKRYYDCFASYYDTGSHKQMTLPWEAMWKKR